MSALQHYLRCLVFHPPSLRNHPIALCRSGCESAWSFPYTMLVGGGGCEGGRTRATEKRESTCYSESREFKIHISSSKTAINFQVNIAKESRSLFRSSACTAKLLPPQWRPQQKARQHIQAAKKAPHYQAISSSSHSALSILCCNYGFYLLPFLKLPLSSKQPPTSHHITPSSST